MSLQDLHGETNVQKSKLDTITTLKTGQLSHHTERQRQVVDVFIDSWDAYVKYGFRDEVKPLSKSSTNGLGLASPSLTLLTPYLMGLDAQFEKARVAR